MEREEAIRRIVEERDHLFALLSRIVRETVCLQARSMETNLDGPRQGIFYFFADPSIDGQLKDLSLRDALHRMPTPTPLPPMPNALDNRGA